MAPLNFSKCHHFYSSLTPPTQNACQRSSETRNLFFPVLQFHVCSKTPSAEKEFIMTSTTNLVTYGSDHLPFLQANRKRTVTAADGTKTGRSRLGVDFQPSNLSVICGRGRQNKHLGNQRFRMLAGTFVEEYSRAGTKTMKSNLVFSIVTMIRQAGGTFCKYEKGVWFEIGDRLAREKVSAFFRDILHTRYRSSSKAKTTLRRDRNRKTQTQIQQYGQQRMVDSTAYDSSDSSMSLSSSRRSSTDSLGFDCSLEIDFFDIDVVF